MRPDRYSGLRINDIGIDEQGRFVLVINCSCTLPHANTAVYSASHADGCLMRPSEGIVFEMQPDGLTVKTWSCEEIADCLLAPVSEELALALKGQMQAMLEADRKATKAKNFRRCLR